MSALGFCSIFSLGWTTLAVAMLPVWNQTDAPCSSGPVLTGSTLTAYSFTDPAGIVSSDQVRTAPSTLASGWLEMYFRPSGSSSRMRTCIASEVPVFRITRRTVAGRCRFMLGGDWTAKVTATDCLPAGSRSAGGPPTPGSPAVVAGASVRARAGSAGGLGVRRILDESPVVGAGSSVLIGDKAGTTPLPLAGDGPGGLPSCSGSSTPAFTVGPVFRLSDFV